MIKNQKRRDMKTIVRNLMVVAAIFVTAVTQSVARVAPTMPEPTTFEAGNNYYLYNVGTKKFVYSYDAGYPYASLYTATAVKIDNYESFYSIQWMNTQRYWYCYDAGGLHYHDGLYSSYTSFRIAEVDNGYAIQRNQYYDESQYVGLASETAEWLTSGNALSELSTWLLLPADSLSERYVAKNHLFLVLEQADSTKAGYNIDKFEAIYNDDTKTNAELHAAANTLTDALSLSQYLEWDSDFPILFEDDPEHKWCRNNTSLISSYDDSNFYRYAHQETLVATVVTDQDATLVYSPYIHSDANGLVSIYIDDELVRTIDRYSVGRDGWQYFETLTPGKHTIKWVLETKAAESWNKVYLERVGVYSIPLINVTTTAAGQLATEVLNFWPDTNHKIDEVRRLKVKGPINSQDFVTIDMMTMLFDLDLSEADCKSIADNEFNRDTNYGGKSSKNYLYKIKLPGNLETIGERAFFDSYIDEFEFPSTLKSIGVDAFMNSYIRKAILPEGLKSIEHNAFYACYALTEASMPDSLEALGERVFDKCRFLKKIHFPAQLTYVPAACFYDCNSLEDMPLHDGITTINSFAFRNCYAYKGNIPAKCGLIGSQAFMESATDTVALHEDMTLYPNAFDRCRIRHLVIPENVRLCDAVFYYNTQLESVEFPTSYFRVVKDYPASNTTYYDRGYADRYYQSYSNYSSDSWSPILDCSNLKTVTLKSPTMVSGDRYKNFLNGCGSPTIRVPKYLQNSAYRQDSYWYNYTIEGFSTADVESWIINAPLTLNGSDRFEGAPDVTLNSSLAINGETAMALHNVDLSDGSMVLSNCENIQVQDTLCMRINTTGNVWRYLSLPFNFKVSDIYPTNGAHTAMYYYDGARRAQTNSASGNWVRMPQDTIVTAGTGFIFQTSKDETTYFYAVNDGEKQKVFGCDEYVRDLSFNDAESTANRGWNLVGNPYLCYYNLHKLNYTAPITVATSTWNSYYTRNDVTYTAYSIVDDDYALRPREAFFVQCASAESSRITFPVAGRQLTSEITDQTGARPDDMLSRCQIDITLTDSEERTDRTRLVLNPKASMDYELTCDASKFMSTDVTMPQIYTLDTRGTSYAINERPESDGGVHMGLYIPSAGTYTLSINRNNKQLPVLLYDTELDQTINLHEEDYTFYAKGGTLNNRFILFGGTVTNIDSTHATDGDVHQLYDLQGRRISENSRGGIYVIRKNGHAQKYIVK